MLTKEMFEGRPFEPFVAVVFHRYEEYDPETESMLKLFTIMRIREDEFDQYEYVGEGSRKGLPRVQRVEGLTEA